MRLPDELVRRCLKPVAAAWEDSPLRRAAVLAPMWPQDGEDWLLFTVRKDHLRTHGGQVAFPGGAAAGDESPLQCALREAEEELGLPRAAVAVLGGLEPRTSSSGYRVHAVVGRIQGPAELRPDPGEVAQVLLVPVAELWDPARWVHEAPPAGADGRQYPPSPHFRHRGGLIWGLTGRLCWDLLERLRGA